MAGVAGGELAAEVCKAGGLGFVGAGHLGLDNLESEVEKGRTALGLDAGAELPFGVGLILWRLEQPHLDPSSAASTSDGFLSYIVRSKARAVWFAFSPDLESWVRRFREIERDIAAKKGQRRRVAVFIMVQTEEMALKAKDWAGVDVIIAQGKASTLAHFLSTSFLAGTDAGGHGPSLDAGKPLFTLLSRLAPHFPSASPPFLLAAGGLSSPALVSHALTIGAAACVSGTSLQVAKESLLPQKQKDLVVRTEGGQATERGLTWDRARGTVGWPDWVNGRAIKNLTSEEVLETPEAQSARYKQAVDEGDVDRVVTWAGMSAALPLFPGLDSTHPNNEHPRDSRSLTLSALVAGTGVGFVNAIRPAREIVADLASEL
ncbi:SPOSA6832_02786 [Sporobolomyces salmonicolor]|uniref:SPOSA6832_02786-mRNA-1:cds n=1 Tax=Sporidiobolus salmonicolor TaxID=5005 RepID=A0A0D6EM72_SPOSA|nr:SPOSA6832_02786 [Sporobolomyces salmonicolor]